MFQGTLQEQQSQDMEVSFQGIGATLWPEGVPLHEFTQQDVFQLALVAIRAMQHACRGFKVRMQTSSHLKGVVKTSVGAYRERGRYGTHQLTMDVWAKLTCPSSGSMPFKWDGWRVLQLDTLKESFSLAELLNDYEGALLFASALIKSILPTLPALDQKIWLANTKRVASKLAYIPLEKSSKMFGLCYLPLPSVYQFHDPSSEALDRLREEFQALPHLINQCRFVSRIRISPARPDDRRPAPLVYVKAHKGDGGGGGVTQKNLFIYDPYAAKNVPLATIMEESDDEDSLPVSVSSNLQKSGQKKDEAMSHVIAAGEKTECEVVFQNPFQVAVGIEQACLVVCSSSKLHVEFDTAHATGKTLIQLEPTTRQGGRGESVHLSFSILAESKGDVRVYGILIRFAHGWVEFFRFGKRGRICRSLFPNDVSKWTFWPIRVVDPQPILKVIKTNLVRSRECILFEGEEAQIEVMVESLSGNGRYLPVNWMMAKCIENVSKESKLEMDAEDAFEHSRYTLNPVMSTNPDPLYDAGDLQCGRQVTVKATVLGKLGSRGGRLELDYGHRDKNEDGYFIRKLIVEIDLTVVRPLKTLQLAVLPLWVCEDIISDGKQLQRSLSVEEMVMTGDLAGIPQIDEEVLCLVSFDIFNDSTIPFHVRFHVRQDVPVDNHPLFDCRVHDEVSLDGCTVLSVLIFPSQTKRIAIPIRRMELSSFLEYLKRTQGSQDSFEGPFCIESIPNDLIQSAPPIPMPRGKQYVLSETGEESYSFLYAQLKKAGKRARESLVLSEFANPDAVQIWTEGAAKSDQTWWFHSDSGSELPEIVSYRDLERRSLDAMRKERLKRLMFWYKDQLFRRAFSRVEWEAASTSNPHNSRPVSGTSSAQARKGVLELRKYLKLTQQDFMQLKLYSIRADLKLTSPNQDVQTVGRFRYRMKLGDSAVMTALLRLEFHNPFPHNYIFRYLWFEEVNEVDGQILYDLSGKMACDGTGQVLMKPNDANKGAASVIEIPVYWSSVGTFKMISHFERMFPSSHWAKASTTDEGLFDELLHWSQEPLTVEVVD